MENECRIQEIAEQPTVALSMRASPREFPTLFSVEFTRLMDHLQSLGIVPGYLYVRFAEMDQPKWDVEIGVATPKALPPSGDIYPSHLPGCRAASTLHRGQARDMESVYHRLQAWIRQQNLHTGKYVYEIFMEDPRGKSPDETYAGMMIPLLEKPNA